LTLDADHVFQRERHTHQRSERFAALTTDVDGAGLGERPFLVHEQEGVKFRFALAYPAQTVGGYCLGGYLSLLKRSQQIPG
jgi:hypothetical protein